MTINLHVFSPGCPEIERMLAFRDWLRANPSDRELYADAKTEVVKAIMERARPADAPRADA